ncbi:MAG: hypothetical protein MI976_12935 [Pseudomonadales bacterium]|nr:hypothetical protein [Pseudomonadales bacterium]
MKHLQKHHKHIVLLTIMIGALLTASCSTTFKLPKRTEDMETVYLLKYSTWGHHSLAFYRNGSFVEYTYGDWELFALNKRDVWTAWKNMTFDTQGTLGRKSVDLKPGDPICEQFVGCERVVPFDAPSKKVNALAKSLQHTYDTHIESQVYNAKEAVYFVKHDTPYWGFHNCNHQLVEWLEFLGAEVEGRVFYKPSLIENMQPKNDPIEKI